MLRSTKTGNVFQLDPSIDTVHVTVKSWPANKIQFQTQYNEDTLLVPISLTCGGCREAKLPLEEILTSLARVRKTISYNYARCPDLCKCSFVARVAITYHYL